jgi:hypothetical protein
MAGSSQLLVSEKPPHVIVSDGTPRVLVDLIDHPEALVTCTFGHDRQSMKSPAMAIWYMHIGCVALHRDSGFHMPGLNDFKVQALCTHHNDRQEPLAIIDETTLSQEAFLNVPVHLLSGSHLLVDLTIGKDSNFPAETWADSGPHWSDTAGPDGGLLSPALELGYGLEELRDFADSTDLGRLVFSGYAHVLA